MNYRACSDLGGCGRRILTVLFDAPSAHAPGCKHRRSLLARENARQRKARIEVLAERRARRQAQRGSA